MQDKKVSETLVSKIINQNMERIEFNKAGYDPQIDYIKGLCILFVIWTHCTSREELGNMFFPYWGDTAVPIFLVIQVFHYYKKGVSLRMPSVVKLWKRILQPFIIMIALMFLAQFFIYYDVTKGTFSPSFYWEKRGPGSYYIFIYLELAIFIPLFAPLFKKLPVKWLFVIFVVLSQLVEMICSITQCPDTIYRISFFRYSFLIFIGYLLATKGLELNRLTILGGIISVVSLYLFNYTDIDMEPFYYTSLGNWKYCHWICYIYIAYFFLWFLKYTHTKLCKYPKVQKLIEIIGKYSYEVYLFQIFYYATISIYVRQTLWLFRNYPIQNLLYILISTAICIMPILFLKDRKQH